MATKTDGTTWGAGYGGDGAYGDDTTATRSSPVQIGSVAWSKITSGFHTVVMDSSGSLYSFAQFSPSILGRDTHISVNRSSPVQVGSATNWVSSSLGSGHSAGIKTDGTLWGWGSNTAFQMGDGTQSGRSSPVQIGTATGYKTVDCGLSYTIAIRES